LNISIQTRKHWIADFMKYTCLFLAAWFYVLITACEICALGMTEKDMARARAEIDEEFQWLKEEANVTFVVTASRVLEDIRKSSASITVVKSAEIRQMGARNLMDVLRTIPGIQFLV